MEPPEAFSEELRQLETERTEQLKKIDERSVCRFDPAGIAAILRSHGFSAIEDIDFQEIAVRFGRAVQGLAPGHAVFMLSTLRQRSDPPGEAGRANSCQFFPWCFATREPEFDRIPAPHVDAG